MSCLTKYTTKQGRECEETFYEAGLRRCSARQAYFSRLSQKPVIIFAKDEDGFK